MHQINYNKDSIAFKVKLLLPIVLIILIILNVGCNSDNENIIEPTVYKNTQIKGLKSFIDGNSPAALYNFEYRNDTIVNIKYSYNGQQLSEREIFYNNNGIDYVEVTGTSSFVSKYTINFEYENGLLKKTYSLGNFGGDCVTDYYYKNNKLDKIIVTKKFAYYAKDSIIFSDFDSFSQRPGLEEYYTFNEYLFKLEVARKTKKIYSNGNLIEIYDYDFQQPEKFKLINKVNYNSELNIYDKVMSIASISPLNPYISNNYNKNNIIDSDSYNENCNGKIYEDNTLISTQTYNYIKNSKGDVERIFRYIKNYCTTSQSTNIIEFKY